MEYRSFGKTGTAVIGGVTENSVAQAIIDAGSSAMVGIDFVHHKVHDGDHYFHAEHYTLDDEEARTYLISLPDDIYVHLWFDVSGSAITEVQFFEGTTRTGSTDSIVVPVNNNRNSSNTSSMSLFSASSTDGSDGTEIFASKGGSSSRAFSQPHSVRGDDEIILKKDTKYLLRATSGTDSNLVTFIIEYYEA